MSSGSTDGRCRFTTLVHKLVVFQIAEFIFQIPECVCAGWALVATFQPSQGGSRVPRVDASIGRCRSGGV